MTLPYANSATRGHDDEEPACEFCGNLKDIDFYCNDWLNRTIWCCTKCLEERTCYNTDPVNRP